MVSSAIPANPFEPSVPAANGNHVPLSKTATKGSIRSTETTHDAPPKHIPTLTAVMPEAPKNYKDVLSYEDKWIGWDGPVWCKRYGRFENADDAAKDDGFESAGQVHHQDLGPHHKHNEQCTCVTPSERHSYAKDINRRVEPVVASIVSLEHTVAKLIHHVGLGTHILNDDKPVLDTEVSNNSHHEANERFAMHDDGLSRDVAAQAGHKNKVLAKLEAEIHALQRQVHELMKKDGATEGFVRNS